MRDSIRTWGKTALLFILVLLFLPIYPAQLAAAAPVLPLIDFEDGTVMGFEPRGHPGEEETLTVTDEEAHSGSYSLLVTDREMPWHGPSLNVTEYIEPGKSYTISVWVLPKDPESSQFRLSTQIGEGDSASYHNLMIKRVSVSDGWTELTATYVYPEDNYITVYVENDSANAEFYIDDVEFYQTPGAGMVIDLELPSLAEVYKDYFLIGSAYYRSDFTGARFELMKHHFNVMTAANDMKPDALGGTEKGDYNFARADAMLDQLEAAGILSHGHALVWHSQSAAWLNKSPDGTVLTRTQAKANMEDYITTVAGHFAGRLISWDVVNEAFQTSYSNVPSDWRDALRKGGTTNESSAWYGAYENGANKDAGESGADYIYDAFVFARLADPGAILYYNDFNETEHGKREAIAKMTEELNDKWKSDPRNTEPDRLLIEGLGLQAHYWIEHLDPKDVEDTILRWIETGAELSITELDIPTGDWNAFKPFNEIEEVKQGVLYARLFRIFMQYSDHIARVTFWGIDDDTSWRREGSPLLFDATGRAKLAFFAVMDPEGFLQGDYFEQEEPSVQEPAPPDPAPPPENPAASAPPPVIHEDEKTSGGNTLLIVLIAIGSTCLAVVIVFIVIRKKRSS